MSIWQDNGAAAAFFPARRNFLQGDSAVMRPAASQMPSADDYIAKPFSTQEFMARVRPMLRRALELARVRGHP